MMMPAASKTKPLLFLAAGLLMGAALGYGLGMDAIERIRLRAAQTVNAEPNPATAPKSAPTSADGTKAAKKTDRYVQMGQFIVPVLRAGHTQAFVLADVTLDMGTSERAAQILASQPRYRDAILQSLYIEAGNGAFEAPDFNPARLGEHIGAALAQSVPDVPIERVMFARLLLQDNNKR